MFGHDAPKFGNNDLRRLVELAGNALKEEHIRLAGCANKWRRRDRAFGICYNVNERYYQFIIWRALMCEFPWRPATERGGHDLVFYDDETEADKPVAVAEMKGWWSSSGEPELPGIKRDIKQKLAIAPIEQDIRENLGLLAVPGIMLIFTAQPKAKDKQDENYRWLAKQLEVDRNGFVTYGFEIEPHAAHSQEATEFTVIGFIVKQTVSTAST